MRKLFWTVVVLAVIGLSLVVARGFAVDATEAINPEAQPAIFYGQARSMFRASPTIAKISAEPTKIFKTGQQNVREGACRIYSVSVYSDTAGDTIGLWDVGTNAGAGRGYPSIGNWLEFEIGISANTSSATAYLHGCKFENGIYLSSSDSANTKVTIVYDY